MKDLTGQQLTSKKQMHSFVDSIPKAGCSVLVCYDVLEDTLVQAYLVSLLPEG